MSTQGFIDLVKVLLDIIVSGNRADGMAKKARVMSMATIQYLMNDLPEKDLYRLSRNESIGSEVAVLALTFPEAQNIGRQTKPWTQHLWGLRWYKSRGEYLLICHSNTYRVI